MKHQRNIELTDWQLEIVDEQREAFLCGLIDSDGCRIVANYREKNGVRRQYGRYAFSNRSEQIHQLFRQSLDALGIRWTKTRDATVVARQAEVRRLDQFIGFKE